MAGPKNQELGIRSPLRRRGGIDFPNWEGINRQNDPGAIRDTQLFTGINCRSNGNEIINRGGMTKVSETQMDGCVYGFIDVPEGATSLFLVADCDSETGQARLDRYYSEGTPDYSIAIPLAVTLQPLVDTSAAVSTINPLTLTDNTKPRRSLGRFNGSLLQFGSDAGSNPTLYKIILPERTTTLTGDTDFLNQTKLEGLILMDEFSSSIERQERVSDTLLMPVLYVGSVTKGLVYRWDGIALSSEDTGLDNNRHIMANFHGSVVAVCNDKLSTRDNLTGAWTTTSLSTTNFVPCAAYEYLTKLYIVGSEGGDVSALTWDGTSIVDISVNFIATTPGVIADVNVFNGLVYFLWDYADPGPTNSIPLFLTDFDGSSYHTQTIHGGDDASVPGCLEPFGDRLWFTWQIIAAAPAGPYLDWVDTANTLNLQTISPSEATSLMMDMVAF